MGAKISKISQNTRMNKVQEQLKVTAKIACVSCNGIVLLSNIVRSMDLAPAVRINSWMPMIVA